MIDNVVVLIHSHNQNIVYSAEINLNSTSPNITNIYLKVGLVLNITLD